MSGEVTLKTGEVTMMTVDSQTFVVFDCPHCGAKIMVLVSDINCGIFRHGAGVGPHASKVECDARRAAGDKTGCFNPIRISNSQPYQVSICEYI